jgi:hypothetical protein
VTKTLSEFTNSEGLEPAFFTTSAAVSSFEPHSVPTFPHRNTGAQADVAGHFTHDVKLHAEAPVGRDEGNDEPVDEK